MPDQQRVRASELASDRVNEENVMCAHVCAWVCEQETEGILSLRTKQKATTTKTAAHK